MTTVRALFRGALPVRPFRLIGVFLVAAALRVPLYAAAATGVMLLSAIALGGLPGGRALPAIGAWSVAAILGAAGAIGGGLAGMFAAAERALRAAESDLEAWFARLPRDEGDRLLPSASLESFRSGYDAVIDRMFDETIGRLPMLRFGRRLALARFRHAMVDDFLDHCERAGASVVGFSEMRDYLVGRGLPLATAPLLVFGILGALFGIPLLIGLLGGRVSPVTIVLGTFAALAVVTAAVGWSRAGRSAAPWRYRLGVLGFSAGLAVWPPVYVRLWPHDLGMVWLLVIAATVATFHWAARRMI